MGWRADRARARNSDAVTATDPIIRALSGLQTLVYRAEALVRVEPGQTDILQDATNLSSKVRDRNLQNEVDFADVGPGRAAGGRRVR